MHIALISTDYPPLRTSAAVQMQDLAIEMLYQGHKPVMIVPSPKMVESWKVEDIEGVTVLRLRTYPFRDISYFQRTLSEFLLPFIMFYRLKKSPFSKTKWDLITWYSPTIFFGPLIWLLKRSNICPAYLILRDIFPEWAVDLGLIRKGLVYRFFKLFAHLQYKLADTIGVQSVSNLKYISKWSNKAEVLNNWQKKIPDVGSSIDLGKTVLAGRKILAYTGNMGIAQGIDILIDLAENLKGRDDLGFVFIGRGSEVKRLKEDVAKRKLDNVLFFDEVSSKEMPNILLQCYLGLISLDSRHKTHNIPGKFLTYILYGLPVLGRASSKTDLSNLVHTEKIGKITEGNDIKALQNFIEETTKDPKKYEEMSVRGKALAKKMFSPHSVVKQIISSKNQ